MDSLRNLMQRHTGLMIAVLVVTGVIGGLGGEALASVACTNGGGVQSPGLCTISAAVTTPCPYALALPAGENLLITSTGSIKCDGPAAASGQNITISVPGGDMEMEAGSEITSENTTGAGNGGNIVITVSGDFTMQGTGVAPNSDPGLGAVRCSDIAGACISSSDLDGGGGKAGNITITVGNFPNTPPVGIFTMQPGSAVLANSTAGSAGAISVSAGLSMDVDGLVRSYGGLTGVGGTQAPGGGPVTLKSGCQLVITPDGVVSSEGKNPGADLVHLEGCEVTVNGLVRSIAIGNGGHAVPNSPANHCNNDPITHPVANTFTACVEIWANNITINSILPNKGEVSADGVSDSTPADTRAWIDVFAKTNITINNDAIGPYSVHANAGLTEGDFGGLITIKAELGAFTITPSAGQSFAVQANATGQSGQGGDVIIEAGSNVALNAGVVLAQGGATGTNRTGGSIAGRSFNGLLSGQQPGLLNANAGTVNNVTPLGVITLQGCGGGGANDGVNYTGTTLPPATVLADVCGGQPTMPAAFLAALAVLAPICELAPDCVVAGQCIKTGRKFHDVNNNGQDDGEPGLSGWQICAFDNTGTLVPPCQVTDPLGNYQFALPACGTFTFCEVLQPTWTQTFPSLPSADPTIVSCEGLVGAPGPLGPVGYQETLVENVPSEGNDFGNFQDVVECPEDLDAVCTITVGAGGLPTVQAAYNVAADGATICLFSSTTENVVLGGTKSLTITQCTVARVTALNKNLPAWTVSSTGKLTIIGPDAKEGTIGWLITSDGHDIRGVRASGATQVGIKITGNNNSGLDSGVSFNSVSGSPVGVRIEGDGNQVRGGTVSGNSGNGVEIGATASNNSFSGATVKTNGGAGIVVEGTGNTLDGNRVNGNTGHGIHIKATATGTKLKSNQSGNPENGGAEYKLDVAATNQGGNRADGIGIPKLSNPQKCPTFAAVSTCE